MPNLIQIREEKRLFKCVEKCPDGHLGEVQTHSKFIATAGDVDINAIKKYIENQKNV